MFTKTSSIPFLKYGEVHTEFPSEEITNSLISHDMALESRSFSCFYQPDQVMYIQCLSGIALLVVTDDLDKPCEEFVISRVVKINPGIYFNVLPLGSEARVAVNFQKECKISTSFLASPYRKKPIRSQIRVDELIAYFYNVRGHNYYYAGGQERCWEFTYVDSGQLEMEINGEHFLLKSNEFVLSAPGDYVVQTTQDQASSYLTIMFHMTIDKQSIAKITGKVRQLNPELRRNLDNFVRNPKTPYLNDLLINSLQHFILNILIDASDMTKTISTPMQQKFENELLDEILLYINENICSAFNVEDLCREFAMSRSTLQTLFTTNLNVAPKQFISSMKLRKSRVLIKESKYTISEIAGMLGYSSIHYFSRKFKNEYGMTPSEYAHKLID